MRIIFFLYACTFFLTISLSTFAQEISERFIRERLEGLKQGKHLRILGDPLYSSVIVPQFYESRQFQPAWISEKQAIHSLDDYMEAIASIATHGLNPDDYHFRSLLRASRRLSTALQEGTSSPQAIAEFDILLTDAFVLMASHLYMGKVDPESVRAEWKIQRGRTELDIPSKLEAAIQKQLTPVQIVESLGPQSAMYKQMQDALAYYISLSRLPEKEPIALNKSLLRPEESDPNVPLIRSRLVLLLLMEAGDVDDQERYDSVMVQAIKKLQAQNGINQDGIIGRGTLEWLNMGISARISLLEANLERMRWLPESYGEKYVWVNIADQRMMLLTPRDTLFNTRAIIGREYRKTPVFQAQMDHLVFSPTWTIPPTILHNDVIPAVRKDIGYLASKNMQVLTFSGQVVDPSTIDWKGLGRNFPYMIRQNPGPDNALGLVKFMFPNSYNVYIHDTPGKSLFQQDDRALSSGCIRIENPEVFAKLLLEPQSWDPSRIQTAMHSNREQTVRLQNPVPTYITYLTAWADAGGNIHFRRDIYSRNKPLLEALKDKPRVSSRR